ncbi:MAG TPA: fused MFS/spermidine synthase [Thermoanaerobaculia bacterium]|nr:fused MFS/spermidine synthase [Thermoanaerobaculia bacterium]
MTRDTGRVAALLFFSGMCALVYQTVWLRQLRLIFGASTFATGAVLAIFMAGLGIGSARLGKLADRKERPLRYYAQLELFIALAAAVSPLLLLLCAKIYFASGGSLRLGLFGATVLRLLLSALILGPATVLMGGTLPAAARAVETHDDPGRRIVAMIYGANTLGAVAGTLLSTFVLLERFGNRATLFMAVAANLVVALIARAMSGNPVASQTADTPETAEASAPRRFIYAASAIAGFAFLLMELVWYRMLSPILGGTTYMFGLVLAVALAGIGIGGAAYALLRPRRVTILQFALTCTLEGLAMAIPFALGDRIAILANGLRTLGPLGFHGSVSAWLIVTGIVVFPAAVVSGIQFPLLVALLGRGRDDVGKQIGSAYAWNTAGAIAGSLCGGFGVMPLLSAPGTWRFSIALLTALGLGATALAMRERPRIGGAFTALVGAAALICIATTGPTAVWRHSGIGAARAQQPVTRNELQRWINDNRRTVLWERDGRESSVALVAISDVTFIINGKSDGSARGDAGTQVMQGLIPSAIHPNPRSALVVGLGTGSSAGWLGLIPTITRVDAVELEPVVLDVARACTAVNGNVLANPKVHVTIADAREVLLTTDRRYDVITSEPSNPYRAGIASLFTAEFYEAVRGRLNAGGIFAQWVQSYAVHRDTIRTIYATLGSVFPNVQTWWTSEGDLLLVASATPLTVDSEQLRARLRQEPFRSAAVNTWRVASAEGFLAHMIANENFARLAAKQAPELNTDDVTVIEFGFARSVGAGANLHRQIVSDAKRIGATHPQNVRGTIDWTSVERERPWARSPDAPAQRQPVEADLLLAALLSQQARYDDATAQLVRAFEGYRRTPWPQPELMASAFPLALELARRNPKNARMLDDALSQPFAAMQHENSRVFDRVLIASMFEPCGPRVLAALRALEPHPIWHPQILMIRANCYNAAAPELAPKAWDELQQFMDAEEGPVVAPTSSSTR